ncbi:MAG: sugar phosphate isomerase/epimerase [Tannerellaceae bacterium]|nr:sugar phosphate isomerase/epimerase [Tannerellaceae bacterium]
MNPLFGTSILSWIPPMWTAESGLYAIQQTAKYGFDLLEILLPPSMEFDAATVKKQLKNNNIQAVCSLNLPKEAHIPFYPGKAKQLIKTALDKTAQLETNYLGGVLHSGIGVFTGKQRTKEEEDILCEVWDDVAGYAAPLGITIGIEPINRYESYVCTSAEEVLTFIKRVGAPNLALHLDTFHMNIEENNFYDPVVAAGSKLRHVHMTESDRGMLGEGTVCWEDLFRALHEIDFNGNLVLENFSNTIPGMAEAVSLWRPSQYGASDLAVGSLAFMKKMAK